MKATTQLLHFSLEKQIKSQLLLLALAVERMHNPYEYDTPSSLSLNKPTHSLSLKSQSSSVPPPMEFTFSTTTEPSQIDSYPPLWHVISSSSFTQPHLATSQSQAAQETTSVCDMAENGRLNEEKMDMLWEDFNEELQFKRETITKSDPSVDFSKEMVQFGCSAIKPLSIYRRKGTNESVAVYFLKKLFLNHNTQKTRSKSRSQ